MLLVVTEARRRNGQFSAVAEGLGEIVASSRTPFLTAARKLLALGVNPETELVMRHSPDGIDCLTSTVGAAAKLTVEEGGGPPKFRVWQPHPMSDTQDED